MSSPILLKLIVDLSSSWISAVYAAVAVAAAATRVVTKSSIRQTIIVEGICFLSYRIVHNILF